MTNATQGQAKELAAKIEAIGLMEDARRAAADYSDMGGLIYIANIATDVPGITSMKLFAAIDLADFINATA